MKKFLIVGFIMGSILLSAPASAATPSFVVSPSGGAGAFVPNAQAHTQQTLIQKAQSLQGKKLAGNRYVVRTTQECKTTPKSRFFLQVISPTQKYKVQSLKAQCPLIQGGKVVANTSAVVLVSQNASGNTKPTLAQKISRTVKSFLVTKPSQSTQSSKKLMALKASKKCPFNPSDIRNNIVTFLVDDTGKKLIAKCGEQKPKTDKQKAKDINDIGKGANNGKGAPAKPAKSEADKLIEANKKAAAQAKAQQPAQGGGQGAGQGQGGGQGAPSGPSAPTQSQAREDQLQAAFDRKLKEIEGRGAASSTQKVVADIESYGSEGSDESDFDDPWDDDLFDDEEESSYGGTDDTGIEEIDPNEQPTEPETPNVAEIDPNDEQSYEEITDFAKYYSPDDEALDESTLREFFNDEEGNLTGSEGEDNLLGGQGEDLLIDKADWEDENFFEEVSDQDLLALDDGPIEYAHPVSAEQWDTMTLAEKIRYSENSNNWGKDLTPEQVEEHEEERSWFYRWFIGWYWDPIADFFNPKYSI